MRPGMKGRSGISSTPLSMPTTASYAISRRKIWSYCYRRKQSPRIDDTLSRNWSPFPTLCPRSKNFKQPGLSISVNYKTNSQRKGSASGEQQEFINLWTPLSPLMLRRILHNFVEIVLLFIPKMVYQNIKSLCAGL